MAGWRLCCSTGHHISRFVVRDLREGGARGGERQELVRKLVKAVVHSDITQDAPIERGYDQLYDVVIVSLVLEGTSDSIDGYASNASKLGKLVKPGGLILIYGVENKRGFYVVGDESFQVFMQLLNLPCKPSDSGFFNFTLTSCYLAIIQMHIFGL